MSTRAERKAVQRAHFAQLDRISAMSAERRALEEQVEIERQKAFAREHPVTAGIIPLVDYKEPAWRYGR